MGDWKQTHANEAEKALDTQLVQDVIREQLENLGREDDPLAKYGLTKIAMYAASVARAQALGFDPDLLRLSADEAHPDQLRLARAAVVTRSASSPLVVGTRVRYTKLDGYAGTVVGRRRSGRRWLYVVRWDGSEHDSGDYGIRELASLSG